MKLFQIHTYKIARHNMSLLTFSLEASTNTITHPIIINFSHKAVLFARKFLLI